MERLLEAVKKLQEIYELTGLHIEGDHHYETFFVEDKENIGKFIFDVETKRYCAIYYEKDEEIEIYV